MVTFDGKYEYFHSNDYLLQVANKYDMVGYPKQINKLESQINTNI